MNGYKTYLVGLGFIIYGVVQIAFLDRVEEGVESILKGAAAFTVRHAIAKASDAAVVAAHSGRMGRDDDELAAAKKRHFARADRGRS